MNSQSKITQDVLAYLKDRGYGYASEIRKALDLTDDEVGVALAALHKDGLVRMKEDTVDHDWEYRPT